MAVGDEHGLTEDLYQTLIGRYVATIEVLSKRIQSKDQYIARLETEAATFNVKTEPKEGDIVYEDPSQ